MRRLVLPAALALLAAARPAALAAEVTSAPSLAIASAVHTGPLDPGAFAPGTMGWDLLGAGLINLARLVRRRRSA